jgi:GNAT superfamily N-acetyltransferase
MNYVINDKTFSFSKEIRDNSKLRLSFNVLSQATFGLSFEKWYQAGYWTEKYQPYTLLDDDVVVSNVSVNIIDTVHRNKPKIYIQLGTVMTSPEYRNMGLSKFLMQRVLEDWLDHCDAMYLYANDSVLDFYPKFGFVKANEYQGTICAEPIDGAVRKLAMNNEADVAILQDCYLKCNPFSELPMINNWGLLMFYCSAFMKDSVYYIQDYDAVVIALQEDNALTVFDIFAECKVSLSDVLGVIAKALSCTGKVRLGFALKGTDDNNLSMIQEEDTTMFVLESKENIFMDNRLMMPLLSRA